ncbi:hypothetical protein [Cupriavidus pauculus]|uniref:hypothetical protein n=1 Tax=Cupriavidus pauculus TaxID=82633 RepID=UPI00124513B3|nr:hypothetical protein [Cupriavidus pauculus]KAB0604643.1 hypothetical protein F7R19_03515 [Cupriavidus pauculus]MCM3607068.1 hypothetical protein [Cupriavidus pauculus]UAK98921.1 hypothetical protein K8O84_13010 [Cupriavidus pauculus]
MNLPRRGALSEAAAFGEIAVGSGAEKPKMTGSQKMCIIAISLSSVVVSCEGVACTPSPAIRYLTTAD